MEVWKNPESIVFWLFITLLIFVILLVFIVALIKMGHKKAIEKKQAIFDEKLKYEQNLKQAIIQVQDQERKEIASELHDQISNKLNLVILSLNNLEVNEKEATNQIKSDLKNIISKNRDISHYLFPVEIENMGILSTLQDLSFKYTSSDFEINIHQQSDVYFNEIQTEMQLYRVIQESLTNTLKYSKATEFNIHFKSYRDKIFILISDNGIGFNLEKATKGIGLRGMDTRLKSINASFKFKTASNKGTRLIIVL